MSGTSARFRQLKRLTGVIVVLATLALVVGLALYLRGHNMAVLSPKGPIGTKERRLMEIAIILSAIVVIPVYALTIMIVVKYREGNKKPKKYSPNWDGSRLYESIWWGIPIVIIGILSVITWQSSYALDPYKALKSANAPLQVQVVALDWKWLFIYPDQHVASVNELALPVDTPVSFEITSDSVMNSFWIPNLGSQIYAMPGMSTSLHLQADAAGSYPGSSANISGKGFADMVFNTKAMSKNDFAGWVRSAQHVRTKLNVHNYVTLRQPGKTSAARYYNAPSDNLYNDIVMQYMMPGMNLQEGSR